LSTCNHIKQPIVKEKWVDCALTRLSTTSRIYWDGLIPSEIAGWMLVTPALHLLRGVFGASTNSELIPRLEEWARATDEETRLVEMDAGEMLAD